MKNILILGGAGFIGSNLAEKFVTTGYKVTVIDGLLPETGGSKKNIEHIKNDLNLIVSNISDIKELKKIIDESDLIIDSMAWTSHLLALEDPLYDLKLNCESHLFFIKSLKEIKDKKIIYLSSIGVYGGSENAVISEETETKPKDIQGIHKLTSENYYRFYSGLYGFNVIVLRIPNCFGKNQPIHNSDIGLVGSFIKDSLYDKTITIYGENRKRTFIYIEDLVNVIYLLSKKTWQGFNIFNISGFEKTIYELANDIVNLNNKGKIIKKEIVKEIKNIDFNNSFSDIKLKALIGNYLVSNIEEALKKTIQYFKENLYDLEM